MAAAALRVEVVDSRDEAALVEQGLLVVAVVFAARVQIVDVDGRRLGDLDQPRDEIELLDIGNSDFDEFRPKHLHLGKCGASRGFHFRV